MVDIEINASGKRTKINNFYNAIHFHPTDAIEDKWGQNILNRIAGDKAASFVRIYSMFEDIVSRDEKGNLVYDFELNDKRIDYLVEKGFTLLICYNFMPDCIASVPNRDMGIPRYKGKTVNNSVPSDYDLWEEVCFHYTEHLLNRYGENTLSQWRFHCWNEPDHEYWVTSKSCFDYERDGDNDKITEYTKLYNSFWSGVKKAYPQAKAGGPSAAMSDKFISDFLDTIGSNLDFLSIHAYSDIEYSNTSGKIDPNNILKRVQSARCMLDERGLYDTEIILDEWGAAAGGFLSVKKNPEMIFRENEYFPAFYFALINLIAKSDYKLYKMLICLSGQHKSTYDFDGYRSFFTLSGFPKPIYNGYCLAGHLGNDWLECDGDCIATINEKQNLVIALYSLENATKEINLTIKGLNGGYTVKRYIIDDTHSNAYSVWLSEGSPKEMDNDMKESIKNSGKLDVSEEKIYTDGEYHENITLRSCGVTLIEFVGEE